MPGSQQGGEGFKLFDNLCENYVTIERKKRKSESGSSCLATKESSQVFIENSVRIINQLATMSYLIPDVSSQIPLWFHFLDIVEDSQWANELEELIEHKVQGAQHIEQRFQIEQYPI